MSDATSTSANDVLAAGHGIIAELRQGGLQRAHSLDAHCREQSSALAATMAAATAAGDMSTADAQLDEAASTGRACVLAVQQDASRRIAELASVCMERLLALARSLVAHARYGKPADDGIQWPLGGEAKAVALRQQARRMASELDALVQGYTTLLQTVCEGVCGALKNEDRAPVERTGSHGSRGSWEGEDLDSLCARLQLLHGTGGEAARAKLWDGTRALLYVTLIAGLPGPSCQPVDNSGLIESGS